MFALLYALLSLSDMMLYMDGAVLYPFRGIFFSVHHMFTKINKNDEKRHRSICFVSV